LGRTTSRSASDPVWKKTGLAVPEQSEQLVGEGARLLEPPDVERRLVQREARVRHQRVVVGVPGSSGLAVAPRPK
jgi:hypothetical protein